MQLSGTTATVLKLGTAQTLAWASTYYLSAILAAPIARDLGVSVATVFAAFSVGLVIAGFMGPRAGRAIDALGGRPVLALSNGVSATGLLLLGLAQGPWGPFAAWLVKQMQADAGQQVSTTDFRSRGHLLALQLKAIRKP